LAEGAHFFNQIFSEIPTDIPTAGNGIRRNPTKIRRKKGIFFFKIVVGWRRRSFW